MVEVINQPAIHKLPWDPACRFRPAGPGELEPCKVRSVQDLVIPGIPPVKVRVFNPPGEQPEGGWPVLVYCHGGGWVLGSINSENSFCTRACLTAECLVVSVDYRLAPEHIFPAAVDDSWAAMEWVYERGPPELGINRSKIAVGGSSATAPYEPIKTKLVFDLTRRYSTALFYELRDHTRTHWPMMSVAADGIMTHVERLNSDPVGGTLSTRAPSVYTG
ncbi:hypothetical protein RHS03_04413, partial [Rhizoctonia solani]